MRLVIEGHPAPGQRIWVNGTVVKSGDGVVVVDLDGHAHGETGNGLELGAEQLIRTAVRAVHALTDKPDPPPAPCPICPPGVGRILLLIEGEPGHENTEFICRTCETVWVEARKPTSTKGTR